MVPGQPGASAGSASPLCWVPHSGAWLKWRAGSAGLLVDHNSPRGSAGFGCLLQVAWQGDKKINELKRAKSYICIRKNFKKPKPSLKKIVQEKNGWHFVWFFFPNPKIFAFCHLSLICQNAGLGDGKLWTTLAEHPSLWRMLADLMQGLNFPPCIWQLFSSIKKNEQWLL